MGKKLKTLEDYTEKEKWAILTPKKRAQYIWNYYKLPIIVLLIFIYFIGYNIHRQVTKKNYLLYSACVNVVAGDALTAQLSTDFFHSLEDTAPRDDIRFYTGWYLTTNQKSEYFEYTYASQMKILAAIDDEQLDVVFLDKEAFDAFAQNGLLYNIEEFLKGTDLEQELKPLYVENMEILEDNIREVKYDNSIEYKSQTTNYPMALDFSDTPFIRDAGFTDTVYLAVIANTPRRDMVLDYLRYLCF